MEKCISGWEKDVYVPTTAGLVTSESTTSESESDPSPSETIFNGSVPTQEPQTTPPGNVLPQVIKLPLKTL